MRLVPVRITFHLMSNASPNLTGQVTVKGQVTIPKHVRERLAISPGVVVRFELDDRGEVVLRKADAQARSNRYLALAGCAGPGPNTDEMLALLRGEP